MRIGVLQLNSTIGDFDANRVRLLDGYKQCCDLGAEFVIAPELFLCGYPPRDLLLREDFIETNLAALAAAAARIGPVPLCLGFVDRNAARPGRPLTNSAAVLLDGKIAGRQAKSLLPTYDVFDEDRYFEPAKAVAPFEFKGCKLGITICEDIWNDEDFWPERLYRRDPVKELVAQGADLILNISASPWHAGSARESSVVVADRSQGNKIISRAKDRTRLAMLQRVARDERIPIVQVNLVGANDELIFAGNSVALNAQGEPIALGKSFSEDLFVVDVPVTQRGTRNTELETLRPAFPVPHWEAEEQLFRALSLGIRDYVQKCGFRSVVIGLSGGIDSALTAVLAVDALGADQVLGVSLPARYSSEGSLTDAEALARNLGIRYEVLPIEPPFKAVESQLAKVFSGTKPMRMNRSSRLTGWVSCQPQYLLITRGLSAI